MLGVPAAQQIEDTREEGSFGDTQQNPYSNQLTKAVHGGSRSRDDGPDTSPDGQIQTGADAREDHVGRNLHHHVSSVEDGDGCAVLRPRQVEVLLKAVELGRCDAVAVQVVEEVEEPDDGHQSHV